MGVKRAVHPVIIFQNEGLILQFGRKV